MLVYLDSNIVIYLVEQPVQFGQRATARFAELLAAGDRIVVSDLTRLECRSHAIAIGDQVSLAQYDAFFAQAPERVVLLTTAVCDRAAVIRGQYRLKIPDAIHLGAALEAGCDVFLTNDTRLTAFHDIAVELLG